VWQRRQVPSQQATTRPAPMKEVERMNAVVVRGLGLGMEAFPRRDSYAMEVDYERNCYAFRGFGHMAHHCRNRGQRGRLAENRRLEYGEGRIKGIHEQLDNLKGVENLKFLD